MRKFKIGQRVKCTRIGGVAGTIVHVAAGYGFGVRTPKPFYRVDLKGNTALPEDDPYRRGLATYSCQAEGLEAA